MGGGGVGVGGCIGTRMQMAFITTELFITGYTMGSCQTPPTLRRVAVMCQMSGAAVGFLFFFFFSFPKVNLHSHLPFLIRPLSLWNVTWERKKREDRGEKQSITIIPSKKKNVPPSI